MTTNDQSPRLAVGCMTGTSIDAIDVALVECTGTYPNMSAAFLAGHSQELGPIARHLRSIALGAPVAAKDFARLALRLGELHAETITQLLTKANVSPDLICAHGQTLYHDPPLSLQLLNPAPIARATNTPVVCDLRAADLAASGQGAPITPIADTILYADCKPPCTILNLGGFANATRITSDNELSGFDICACNQLLDAIARQRLHLPFDESGNAAAEGWARDKPREQLADLLTDQQSANRSLGSGDELIDWISANSALSPEDMCATACAAIAQTVARAAAPHSTLVLAGGGVLNAALINAIRDATSCEVILSDELAIPAQYREAAAFAVLGILCADAVPITLPAVTNCTDPAPIAGTWTYPPQP